MMYRAVVRVEAYVEVFCEGDSPEDVEETILAMSQEELCEEPWLDFNVCTDEYPELEDDEDY